MNYDMLLAGFVMGWGSLVRKHLIGQKSDQCNMSHQYIYIFFVTKKTIIFCINFLKALLADNLKANMHGLKAKHNYFTLTKYFIVFTRLMQRQLCLFTG